jgi:hypothetical protein
MPWLSVRWWKAYASTEPADEVLERLSALGVDYVYFGAEEQGLGSPTWLTGLMVVYAEEGVRVYRVPWP